MALALFSALSTLGMSWINASAPKMVQHVARGERLALNRLFLSVSKSAFAFTTAATLLLLLIVAVLTGLGHPIVGRIASLPVLACLGLVTVTNSFIFAAATYMRAHRAEPMLAPSLVGGLLTLTAAYFGSSVSTLLTMSLYAALTLLVGLSWTIALFLPYYQRPG